MKHGSVSAYSNGGCRCAPYKEAGLSYQRERRRIRFESDAFVHGTINGYKVGCRCLDCRAAVLSTVQARAAKRLAEDSIDHGTVNGYTSYRCRCDNCLAAMRSWKQQYAQTPSGKATQQRAARNARKQHPEKQKARAKVGYAIRRGDLVRPNVCEWCGDEVYTEASHTDYAKPLDVEWLCKECHRYKDGLLSEQRAIRRAAKIADAGVANLR